MSTRCYYCQVELVKSHPKERRMTWDHKVPKAKGGTNNQSNLVMACFRCNQEKGVLSADEYKSILLIRAYKTVKPQLKSMVPSWAQEKPESFNREITLEDHQFLYEIGVEAI